MTTHQHEWLTNLFVFPDAPGYEFEEPYVTEYCADRECGERRARLATDDEALNAARDNGRPAWVNLEHEAAYQQALKEAARGSST